MLLLRGRRIPPFGDRWARYLRRQDLTGYDPERLLALGDDLIRAAIDEASG